MLATSPHSGSARFAASLHLVTKDVVWNAAGPSKQLKAGIAQNLSVGFASTLNGWCNDVFVVNLLNCEGVREFTQGQNGCRPWYSKWTAAQRKCAPADLSTKVSTDFKASRGSSIGSATMIIGSSGLARRISSATTAPSNSPR